MDGVSTYLALTFGTLLSSQGTDASFVLTLSGFPPGSFPSVLRVSNLTIFAFRSVSGLECESGGRWRAFAFRRSRTLSEVLSRDFPPRWNPASAWQRLGGPCGRSRQRTGAGRPDANRGGPLLVTVRRGRQTSTTTGRIIGRRR
ncbi:hypothetical protein C6N75_19865 [Streptomyces solincola]|uniref:Uncharacterized protein n=1 Tax=Streptomyces solincola TaxID=2100817 RepID=A0A2S9PSY4_9ACTN|nr:hypothetical protein C6N75_19865 [Streptomyces solincola]